MKKLIYLLAIGAALGLISCGKDGSMGPQGEQGAQGLQGIQGEKGEDGTTIYSGAVAPPAELGNVGDFYFRTSNSDFYGPKTADGWGTATNLRGATGATGATGAAGSKILSGTGIPNRLTGELGDYYLRTSNATLYGPKAGSGWGTPINLRGPQGPPGNANVQQYEITVARADWSTTLFVFGGMQVRGYPLALEQLGGNHIRNIFNDGGAVLAYIRFGPNRWVQMPYSYTYSVGSSTPIGIRLGLNLGSELYSRLEISKTTNGLDDRFIPIEEIPENLTFRIVIIPNVSGISSSNGRNQIQVGDKVYTQSALQEMSYDEVSSVLGLDE